MPPRKRDAAKSRLGTLRPARVREQPALPPSQIGAPPPPAHCPSTVRSYYLALVADLDAQALATRSDGAAILLVAQALAEKDHYRQVIEREGAVYGHGGLRKVHPACGLYDSAWKRCLMGLRALGLSPAARGQIEPLQPPQPEDAMERLLRAREVGP